MSNHVCDVRMTRMIIIIINTLHYSYSMYKYSDYTDKYNTYSHLY